MIRIIIADDHAIVRGGLIQLLKTQTDMKLVGEAGSSAEVIQRVRSVEADVLLLDLSMPGASGVDLIASLRAEKPRLPILVLSMHCEGMIAAKALKAGANGYICKGSSTDNLLAALRKVAKEGRYIDPVLVDALVFDGKAYLEPAKSELSEREFQILDLLINGATVTGIAEQLALSVKTVSTHKTRLMQKLHVRTNAELIRYAITHGLTRE